MNEMRYGSDLPLCGCNAVVGQRQRRQLQLEPGHVAEHDSILGETAVGCETSTKAAHSARNAAGERIDAAFEAW